MIPAGGLAALANWLGGWGDFDIKNCVNCGAAPARNMTDGKYYCDKCWETLQSAKSMMRLKG